MHETCRFCCKSRAGFDEQFREGCSLDRRISSRLVISFRGHESQVLQQEDRFPRLGVSRVVVSSLANTEVLRRFVPDDEPS